MNIFKLVRMHHNGQEGLTANEKELLKLLFGQEKPTFMELEKLLGGGDHQGFASSSESNLNFKSQTTGTTEMSSQNTQALSVILDMVKLAFATIKNQNASMNVVLKAQECLYKASEELDFYEQKYGINDDTKEMLKIIDSGLDAAKHHSALDYIL